VERLVGAVDIGGSKIALGIVGSSGRVYARRDIASPSLCEAGRQGLAQTVAALAQLDAATPSEALIGIGIGCTGPVDPFTGVIGRVDTIRGWSGLNLPEAFRAKFDIPVAVENDADASALAEYRYGSGRDSRRFLYVTISTGIGGGAVLDGRLYRGANGSHPEFGHHIIEAGGRPCYCGARGCWEMLAAGPALATLYRESAGVEETDARRVCELAGRGDELARRAVDRLAVFLGIGLANLASMFAPDVIALGGGVMRSWPLLESRVREVLRRNCNLVPVDDLVLTPARLGEDLPLAGAAESWFHRYDPS
jgi:glucokinase